jgi:3-hydroxyisobutyrate dehydrogenase
MTDIGFIGLGNMGGPMLRNLLQAGHKAKAYDVSNAALDAARAAGAEAAAGLTEAARRRHGLTMLPAAPRSAGLSRHRRRRRGRRANALLIDCSTIDVATSQEVAAAAAAKGLDRLDAPVSGGVAGAAAATLTFMVGGSAAGFARAEPILKTMGKAVVHAGPAGHGQAAKICNNLMLGIQMISVAEAFALAGRLGLSPAKLFEISSQSSGQCWSLTSYCPEPGLVPAAPSNSDYRPGFTAAMMLKDLRLAQQAAHATGAATPLGAAAAALYALYDNAGHGATDFSGIIEMIKGRR